MIDRNRALLLLGSGLGPTDVATTLGCDPSYISQMLMEDEFRQEVLAERIKSLTAQTQRDQKIDSIEDQLIGKLVDAIPTMFKTRDILAAFHILNSAKRRGASVAGGSLTINQNIVSINLPPAARQHFFPKMNAQGEVVQVGDQITQTKPLQQLMQERLQLQQKKLAAQTVEVLDESPRKESRSTEGSTA